MNIRPIDIIKDMSGKVCQHSDTYISLNTSSGKMFTGKRCNPFTGPATAKQLSQQEAFKERVLKITAWLNANKPSATNGERGTASYQEAQRLKKQMALSNVRQVIAKYMDATGKVTLPSGATSNPNANPGGDVTNGNNPNSGGSGSGSSTGGGGDEGDIS